MDDMFERARKLAHSIDPVDFGSTIAIGLITGLLNQVRKEAFEKAAEAVLRKRETDKYPKCCMQAMKDANISSARAIREEMNPAS